MRDVPAGSQPEASVCEYATCMFKAQGLKVGYRELCSELVELPAIAKEAPIKNRLEAEEEEAEAALKAARLIVRNCNGCDENGNRLVGVSECPRETTIQVKEWVMKVVPVHIVY